MSKPRVLFTCGPHNQCRTPDRCQVAERCVAMDEVLAQSKPVEKDDK
jgi:hypothetical protein